MAYTSQDVPYPRGEICVQTSLMVQGYYKNAEQTSNSFDSEGWFHTGDIVEVIGENRIRIIDRKKMVFKLSQVTEMYFNCIRNVGRIYFTTPSGRSSSIKSVSSSGTYYMRKPSRISPKCCGIK